MPERARIRINGVVQGVGFRPFIHRLVSDYALSGMIRNTSSGVEIELDGERAVLERVIEEIPLKAPPLAVIEELRSEFVPVEKPYEGLYVANNMWREMFDFSPDAVLMVFASEVYDESVVISVVSS